MTRERRGVLDPGMRYQDLDSDYERQAAIRRKIACHVREIEALGLDVTLTRPAPERTDQQAFRPPNHPPPQPMAQTAAGCCRLPS